MSLRDKFEQGVSSKRSRSPSGTPQRPATFLQDSPPFRGPPSSRRSPPPVATAKETPYLSQSSCRSQNLGSISSSLLEGHTLQESNKKLRSTPESFRCIKYVYKYSRSTLQSSWEHPSGCPSTILGSTQDTEPSLACGSWLMHTNSRGGSSS